MNRLRPLSQLQERVMMPRLTRPDVWLLAAVGGLLGLGMVMVLNVSYFQAEVRYGDPYVFFRKHLVSVAIGVIAMLLASRVRLDLLERWAAFMLPLCLLGLVLVLTPGIGVERGGAQRWIALGGFSLQPSEFVKLGVVLFLARWISRHRERMASFVDGVLPALVCVGLCCALILGQPDFGTTIILGGLALLMLFIGGARPWHIGSLVLLGLFGIVAAVQVAPYRMRRMFAFLDPFEHSQDSGFQLVQSLIAFGSGGVTGVGLGESKQKMLFLPEAHTDFIFALVGEELGLVGALLVLALFAVIAVRGLRVAVRHPDPFASLLAFGITAVLILSAVVNIGVVLGALPTKGLPLPLMSYGGSALLATMIQVGVLAALSRMTG
ncbi:MAG: putative lipid II flippase FtsW [Candidatus Binatia bacterium]